MYFTYYTISKQEQMAVFAWLTKRGYAERVSNVGVTSSGAYDFVCIDIDVKEFGFFAGKFTNPRNVSYMTPRNFSHMVQEVQLAENHKLISFTFTSQGANSTPWVSYPNIVPVTKLEYKFL